MPKKCSHYSGVYSGNFFCRVLYMLSCLSNSAGRALCLVECHGFESHLRHLWKSTPFMRYYIPLLLNISDIPSLKTRTDFCGGKPSLSLTILSIIIVALYYATIIIVLYSFIHIIMYCLFCSYAHQCEVL